MLAFAHRSAFKQSQYVLLQSSLAVRTFTFPLAAFRASYSTTTKEIISEDKVIERRLRYGKIKNKRSGQNYRTDTANLSAKSMGRNAKVLIIRHDDDEPQRRRKSRANDETSPEDNISLPSIVSDTLANAATELIGLEDAMAAIEELRPATSGEAGPVVIVRAKANELARTLQRQFSVDQLKEYQRRAPAKPVVAEGSPFDRPLPRPWIWDQTAVVSQAGVKLQTSRQTQKAMVVSRILENIWGLRINSAEAESFSVIRIVSRHVRDLLTAGSTSTLDDISRTLSIRYHCTRRSAQPDYRLVLIGYQNALVLATTQIQTLLEKSHRTVEQISVKNLQGPSRAWPRRRPTDRIEILNKDLQTISDDTGALLCRRAAVSKMTPSENAPLVLEAFSPESILAAKQALIPLLQYKASIAELALVTDDLAGAEPTLITAFPQTSPQLPSPYHKFSPKRLSSASTFNHAKLNTPDHGLVYKQLKPTMDKFVSHSRQPPLAEIDNDLWLPHVDHLAVLDLGFVLHNEPRDSLGAVSLNNTSFSEPRIASPLESFFYQSVPNAHHMFHIVEQLDKFAKRTIKVKIQAVPDFSVKPEILRNAPQLSFTFSLTVNEPGPAKLQNGSASISESNHHIMLPNSLVDLRLVATTYKDFNIKSQQSGGLQQFLHTISTRLDSGEPVGYVPGFTLQWPPESTGSSKTQQIPYILSGVTQRETVSFRARADDIADEDRVFQNYIASYAVARQGSDARTTNMMKLHLPFNKWGGGFSDAEYAERLKSAGSEFVHTACWLIKQLSDAQPRMTVHSLMSEQKQADDLGIH